MKKVLIACLMFGFMQTEASVEVEKPAQTAVQIIANNPLATAVVVGASIACAAVCANKDLLSEILQFLSPREATQGPGLVDKKFHNAAEWRSRCAHAAAIAQPIVLSGHDDGVCSVAVSPNGRIVSGSRDRTVRVWNPRVAADQPGHMVVLRGHGGWVTSVAVSPDGRIVSGSSDGTIRVWNPHAVADQPGHVVVLWGDNSWVTSVAVLSDDRIVSGSYNFTVRVWNPRIPAGKPGHMAVLWGHEGIVESVAVLPDGRIVSGSYDGTVRVWNPRVAADQPGHMVVLRRHDSWVTSVAVLPDGRIVSGSLDYTVRVWNPRVAADQPGYMVVLRGHNSCVNSVAVFRDGRIVSGSWNPTVRVWPSERYFEEKVKRTNNREDYLVDGPGVYEILFPRHVAVDNAAASAEQVTELSGDVGSGGCADAPISAAEAAAALAQRDVVIPVMDNENTATPGDEVDNDADERGQTGCCAQCMAGLRRFFGMNQPE